MVRYGYIAEIVALLAIILAVSPGFEEWQSSNPSVDRVNYHVFGGALGLAGQLHLPKGKAHKASKPPVIVFALGMGLVQDSEAMQAFVKAYQSAGFAVFTFDYATFGASPGLPRHQVHPQHHIRDLKTAISYVRTLDSVDASRVGLWGTSLGGGHVLLANDGQHPIKAIVSLVPHVASGLESILQTLLHNPGPSIVAVCSILAAMLEAGLFSFVGKTTYVPLHGEPGSAALMQNAGDDEGYGKLVENLAQWKNAVTVSSVLKVLLYRPANQLRNIPVTETLMITASNDTLCPAAAAKNALKYIPNAQYLELTNSGHFDVYVGQMFNKVVETSINFYKKYL